MLAKTILAAGLAIAPPVSAAVVSFSGTRQNVNPGTVPGTGRCVPPYFSTSEITPGNFSSTGTSNFGTFTAALSHCNLGPTPTAYVDGLAFLDFAAGDSLFAAYTGSTSLTAVPGVFAGQQEWTVTGGTGRFLNASGVVSHVGTLRVGLFEGVRVGIYDGSFEGLLNLPAIPEPGTWAMMILGLGFVGTALRREKNHVLA